MTKGMALAFFVLVLIAGSCSSKKTSVPSGILPVDQMEKVVFDLIQADQYSALYLAKDTPHIDLKMENLRLYEEVFQLHQITREEFKKSFQFYLDHPELNQEVFDSVISRGNRMRSDIYSHPNPYRPAPPPAAGHTPVQPGATPALMPNGKPFPVRGGAGMVPGKGGPVPSRIMPDSVRKRLFHQGQLPFQHGTTPPPGNRPVP